MKAEAVWITPDGSENHIATVGPGEATGFTNYARGACRVMVMRMPEGGDRVAVFETSPLSDSAIEDHQPDDTTDRIGEVYPGEELTAEYEDADYHKGTLLVRSVVES